MACTFPPFLLCLEGCVKTEKDNLLDADLADGADYLVIKSAKSALSASKKTCPLIRKPSSELPAAQRTVEPGIELAIVDVQFYLLQLAIHMTLIGRQYLQIAGKTGAKQFVGIVH